VANSEKTGVYEKKITRLPFEEEQTKESFENYLLFEHDEKKVLLLNFRYDDAAVQYASRPTKRGTFDQVHDISARILYTFEMIRFEHQYHIEIT
jgi:ABC-type microcin C transport system permease subunit YejE